MALESSKERKISRIPDLKSHVGVFLPYINKEITDTI